MKTLNTLLAISVLLLAGAAFAQNDADPDGMGIYFDLGATETCATTAAPFQQVFAYLIITNPSDPTGVSGWEAKVSILGAPAAPSWALAAGLDVDADPDRFQVGIGVAPLALAASPAVVLATWSGYILAPTDVVEFLITDVPGSVSFAGTPGYAGGASAGDLIPVQVSSGYPYTPCAQINTCTVVANDEMNWGQVKSLFQ